MTTIQKVVSTFAVKVSSLKDLSLLLVRLVLAYGFYTPALMKWSDINAISEWFGSMNYPLPTLNAYLAAGTEAAGVILLTLGLFTRFISIPLIIVMLVAIGTVHWGNGFDAGNNGFEIPLYFIMMLLVLISNGAGKFSIDNWITRKK